MNESMELAGPLPIDAGHGSANFPSITKLQTRELICVKHVHRSAYDREIDDIYPCTDRMDKALAALAPASDEVNFIRQKEGGDWVEIGTSIREHLRPEVRDSFEFRTLYKSPEAAFAAAEQLPGDPA